MADIYAELGRRVLGYLVIYAIISTALYVVFVSYGVTAPEALSVMPAAKVAPSAFRPSAGLMPTFSFTDIIRYILGGGFVNFVLTLLGGIPILLTSLAQLSGNPVLVSAAAAVGVVLQFSVYWYVMSRVMGWA